MRVNHHTSEQNLLRRRRFHINRDYNSKKNKYFFRCCSSFTAKEYYLITEKRQINELKYIFVVGWWRFDFSVHILLVPCVNACQFWCNFECCHYCSIKYWHFHGITNVCRCGIEQKALLLHEFLFFWISIFGCILKKNLYVCHSFDKTEIKANFTSIHVNYDENGKTGKFLFVRQSIESRALLKLI